MMSAVPSLLKRSLLRRTLPLVPLAALGTVLAFSGFLPHPGATPDNTLRGAQAGEPALAPELDGGVAWLNTKDPIKLADLRGRVVVLDFWTLCCINCIHTLPDLAKLEAKYPGVLVVIGVHTPKFPHEKKTESIRKAVLRYEVKHPVINDAEGILWRRYRADAWPTIFLIDPAGHIDRWGSGEGLYEALDKRIGELVKAYRAKKRLKEDLLPFQLARLKESANRPLYFPGKVLADGPGNRLFIADSTHHRIVITDLQGKKIAVAGTGKSGRDDGPFEKASFSDPQGMALVGQTLYVADRKNHRIRALDLKAHTVRAVAGTGEQDRGFRAGGAALKTALNSPWDLLARDGKLFIAMAGDHQIWTLDLERGRVDPYAGNGREFLKDGSLDQASFAQPSGLAADGKHLYVADSETSSIRSVPLDPTDGEVKTIVGEGLFEFGDEDGVGSNVRLQHALGVAYRGGKLYVADTYNSKIKVIDPVKASCVTLPLKAAAGDKGPLLNEPGGLSFAGDRLYVADTSSHRIRVIDLKGRTIATLPLEGVEPPAWIKGEPKTAGSR
jgi:sugar lactone lactonase YvrE/thiol-disulfide isomerase/thioredoxin